MILTAGRTVPIHRAVATHEVSQTEPRPLPQVDRNGSRLCSQPEHRDRCQRPDRRTVARDRHTFPRVSARWDRWAYMPLTAARSPARPPAATRAGDRAGWRAPRGRSHWPRTRTMAIHRHPSAVERHASASTGGGTRTPAFDRRPSAVNHQPSRDSLAHASGLLVKLLWSADVGRAPFGLARAEGPLLDQRLPTFRRGAR